MASASTPVWRPLSEQRPPRGANSFPPGQHGEDLRAIMRMREIAIALHGEWIARPADEIPSSEGFWRNLEATKSYDPGTPEARAEWTKVRATFERVARRIDRQVALNNKSLADRRRQRGSFRPQTLRLQTTSHGQARARESRPSGRSRAGPKGDRPRPSNDDEADPVSREAAA
jgi:hypothetical protein